MIALEIIYPPNKPLEREFVPSNSGVRYDHLQFLDINSKGEVIVGSSNITGTFWEGVLCHYKDVTAALQHDCQGSFYVSDSTVSAGRFVGGDDKHVVVTEDNGHVRILRLDIESDWGVEVKGTLNTEGLTEDLSTWRHDFKFVTCTESVLDVWEIGSQAQIRRLLELKNYHTDRIVSVDVDTSHNSIFASASYDRRICTWDDRAAEHGAAAVLYRSDFAEMTSVSWDPSRPHAIIAGCRNGSVYCLDVRQPGECVASRVCFEDAPVHKVRFNHKGGPREGLSAVCGDAKEVVVIDPKDDCRVVYRNDDHKNFVRGLAWNNEGVLFSCGFDKKICRHEVPL